MAIHLLSVIVPPPANNPFNDGIEVSNVDQAVA